MPPRPQSAGSNQAVQPVGAGVRTFDVADKRQAVALLTGLPADIRISECSLPFVILNLFMGKDKGPIFIWHIKQKNSAFPPVLSRPLASTDSLQPVGCFRQYPSIALTHNCPRPIVPKI